MAQRRELHGPPRYFTPDWEAAARSVATLAALEPEVVATGHGEPLRGDAVRADLHDLGPRLPPPGRPQARPVRDAGRGGRRERDRCRSPPTRRTSCPACCSGAAESPRSCGISSGTTWTRRDVRPDRSPRGISRCPELVLRHADRPSGGGTSNSPARPAGHRSPVRRLRRLARDDPERRPTRQRADIESRAR